MTSEFIEGYKKIGMRLGIILPSNAVGLSWAKAYPDPRVSLINNKNTMIALLMVVAWRRVAIAYILILIVTFLRRSSLLGHNKQQETARFHCKTLCNVVVCLPYALINDKVLREYSLK
jgi:hypothetical protein